MTWKDHLDVLLKVCDAVAYAHSKAILHRDLKPDNIMLGDYGEAYVMDWGLAMYFDERNEYKRFPGLKPQLAGTPSYIAPEMVRGKMTRLCPATDIYLLGGILYEILTGRPPHDGDSVMDVLKKAAEGVVPPPEEVSDSPVITPALSRIAMKALAPRIPDRYASVADFQEDIRDCLANSESMAVCQRAAEVLAASAGIWGIAGAAPETLDRWTRKRPRSTTESCRNAWADSAKRSSCGAETKRPAAACWRPCRCRSAWPSGRTI